ncbi:uncharacterized protein LOC143300316 [Babylonia areolata]|uniref:uncharacterized protein LOC143300316 n=1 Tax=Babylonia areolata TaxID=304850 RepID=UPI003FD2EC2B
MGDSAESLAEIKFHCQAAVTAAAAAGAREPRQTCEDAIANCQAYGQSACTQYHAWAQHNCPRFCAFCSGGGASTGGSTCTDVIDNCAALGPNVCHDYVEFVHINCQKTCNLCSGQSGGEASSQCVDKINNCADYGPNACTGQYEPWARDNCPLTCKLCPAAGSGSGGTEGVSSECFYKGQSYKEGQQWRDGCDKNCTCVDARTGYYLCQELCPTYNNLPSECQMVTEPGQCCAKPVCPQKSGCAYKGQTYQQGQQWKDGCQYLCTCKDGQQGYYECRAMCVQWNLLPTCHLDQPAPGKCCPTPNCPSNVVIQYPDGYQPL